jgi:hypothetical protein
MKKLVATFTAVVLGFSFVVNAGEKAAGKAEQIRKVKISKQEAPDVYLLWSYICTNLKTQNFKKASVNFGDFQVEIQCKFNK